MDYEKKYKQLHTLISDLYPFMSEYCKEKVEGFFPELKEPEDEKVRKALIEMVHDRTGDELWEDYNVHKEEVLVWLEKQGEQKPTDKVEPKFKVGDWITNGDYTWKIAEVKPLDYILQSQDGNIVDDTISHVDEQFHSFTIQDAKDGDVLTVNGKPFIYYHTDEYKDNYYCIDDEGCFRTNIHFSFEGNCILPATKEQRDTLFSKMKEAGYEWDDEKKELKKISQRMISAEAKEAMYDKPAWSEEDEHRVKDTIYFLDTAKVHYASTVELDACIYWLKSLKQRIGG